MTLRWAIHASAGLAAIILAASETGVKSSPSETVRALALLVVVAYLVFVLGSILLDCTRQRPSPSGDLWDSEIDDYPHQDQPRSKPVGSGAVTDSQSPDDPD